MSDPHLIYRTLVRLYPKSFRDTYGALLTHAELVPVIDRLGDLVRHHEQQLGTDD